MATTFSLPRHLEDDLRSLAEQMGQSEQELVLEAVQGFLRQHGLLSLPDAKHAPWPTSIGMASVPDFDARNTEAWLEEHYHRNLNRNHD